LKLRRYDPGDDAALEALVASGEGWAGPQVYRPFSGDDMMYPVVVQEDNGKIIGGLSARLVGELVLVVDRERTEYIRSKAIYKMAGSVIGNLERSGVSQINVPIMGVGNTERAKEFGFVKDPREIWVRW
jgi:hypothetical protein